MSFPCSFTVKSLQQNDNDYWMKVEKKKIPGWVDLMTTIAALNQSAHTAFYNASCCLTRLSVNLIITKNNLQSN